MEKTCQPKNQESILVQFPVCEGCIGRNYDLCQLCGLLAKAEAEGQSDGEDDEMTTELPAKAEKLDPATIPEKDRPISELYRVAAHNWAEADGLARELEEKKSIYISEQINKRCELDGKLSKAAAESQVKASPQYIEFIAEMTNARTEANHLRAEQKYYELKHSEWLVKNAAARRERDMY